MPWPGFLYSVWGIMLCFTDFSLTVAPFLVCLCFCLFVVVVVFHPNLCSSLPALTLWYKKYPLIWSFNTDHFFGLCPVFLFGVWTTHSRYLPVISDSTFPKRTVHSSPSSEHLFLLYFLSWLTTKSLTKTGHLDFFFF